MLKICSRSLIQKRKELSELKETSKALKAQLRDKRKTIFTLEELLKETGRTRGRENRRMAAEPRAAPQEDPPPKPLKPSVIKFFITGPDGLCVEFNQKVETTIKEIKREIKHVFISRKSESRSKVNKDGSGGGSSSANNHPSFSDMSIKLLFQGRVILDDSTLESVPVNQGDTLVAVVERDEPQPSPRKETQQVTPPAPAPAPAPVIIREERNSHLELLEKQNEMIRSLAMEMR